MSAELIARMKSSVLGLKWKNIVGEDEVFATVVVWDFTDSEVLLLSNYHIWNLPEFKSWFPPSKSDGGRKKASKSCGGGKKSSKSGGGGKKSSKSGSGGNGDEHENEELTLFNVCGFEHKFVLTSEIFLSCDETADFAVLKLPKEGFDMERIPISLDVSLTLKVHSLGYLGHTQKFNVACGEVCSLGELNFTTNIISAEGYSGAAIIADSLGRAVGYMGGNWDSSVQMNSQHQSYAMKFDAVVSATGRQLTPPNSPTEKRALPAAEESAEGKRKK
jgi:hypothetical protein